MRFLVILTLFFAISSWAEPRYYRVQLEPDLKKQSIIGMTEIDWVNADYPEIIFPLYGLMIKKVLLNNKKIKFIAKNGQLTVYIRKAKNFRLKIFYSGNPTKGLFWGKNYVYTTYDPCTWMICLEEPQLRIPLDLKIIHDPSLVAVTSEHPQKNGFSSYLYGFALGKFQTAELKYKDKKLKLYSDFDSAEGLLKKFASTKKVIKFFEEKSGVKLPLNIYSQVLVSNSEAQEKNGFSILGKDEVDPILKDPTEDWAIVHELAHQWWGNLITCKTWDHFWLNEGLTVFMTTAYKQQAWGQKYYEREMELAQKRYQKALDAKLDVPLSYSGTYPSLSLKRAIVYNKAALFLDALRKELGDDTFWKGLKTYTQNNQYQSVISKDFQTAMESAANKKLDSIFNKWVY